MNLREYGREGNLETSVPSLTGIFYMQGEEYSMKKSGVLGLAVLLALAGGTAHAAGVYELEGVVVTATKIEESTEKVPASISVVTAKEIKDRGYQSVAQALGQEPGVYLSPVANGGISLRGFASSDILVLVDGQPVNSGWNGSVDWTMIPVENIKKIEVLRGAASSLYGGRATGGVISITTNTHEEGVHGNMTLSYGSSSTTKQVYDVSVRKDKWDIGAGYEKRKTDGWRGYYVDSRVSGSTANTPQFDAGNLPIDGRGRVILGGRGEKAWTSESYHAKLTYHFNEDKSLTYSYLHTDHKYSYEHPFTLIKDASGKSIFYGSVVYPNGKGIDFAPGDFLGYVGAKEWGMHNIFYDDNKNRFHVHAGYTDIKKDGYSSADGDDAWLPMTEEETYAWNGEGVQSFYPSKTKDFDLNKTWELGSHTLIGGLAYRANSFDQTRYNLAHYKDHGSKINADEKHRGKDESLSAYFQDKWQASEKFAVYAGLRFDRYKKYGGHHEFLTTGYVKDDEEGIYNAWSPKLSLEYLVGNDTTVYASYGHSFTPPILYQVYRSERSPIKIVNGVPTASTKGSLPNPDLDPEQTDTYELGLKKKWKDTTANIAVYKADTKDAIRYFSTGKASVYNGVLYKKGYSQYRNFGKAKKKGFELSANHQFSDKVSGYLNYAWEMESIDGEHNWDIPKHLIHFGAEFTDKRWDILADAQYVSARQEPDAATGVYYSAGKFFIASLSANYSFTKNTTAQFYIYNLFDKVIYDSEAASGRTYTLTLRHSF